ncbi:hypothetical protein UT300012_22260 [Paraclostridium bifermentans]
MKSDKLLLDDVNTMITRDNREEHFIKNIRPLLMLEPSDEMLAEFYKRYYVLTGKTDYLMGFIQAQALGVFKTNTKELETIDNMSVEDRLELLSKVEIFASENLGKIPHIEVDALAEEQFGSASLVRVAHMINQIKELKDKNTFCIRDEYLSELSDLALEVSESVKKERDKTLFGVEA